MRPRRDTLALPSLPFVSVDLINTFFRIVRSPTDGGGVETTVKKSAADERRSPRAKVFLSAFLESGTAAVPVRIRDLSKHGVLVVGQLPMAVGTEVTLRCNGKSIHGWIAWAADASAGIEFSEAKCPDDLLRSSNVVSKQIMKDTRVADFRRPGFRGNQLTSEERKVLQEWARARQ